jgi:hypothetical protein
MDTTTVVDVPCHFCKEATALTVSVQGLADWQNGELIQNALPELNADQRELLISGTCGTCWDGMFPPEME